MQRISRSRGLLLVLCILLFLGIPVFAGFNDYYVHVACIFGINAILLLGLNIAYGIGGQMNLAQAGFYSLGAYATAILQVNYGWSWWLTLIPAIAIPVLVAVIIGIPSVKLRHHNLAMSTIALGMGIHVFLVQAGGISGGPSGIIGIERPSIFGFVLDTETRYFYLIAVFTIVCYVFCRNLLQSRVGRAILAVRDDEVAARAVGISPFYMKLLSFAISAGFAGIAGSLYASLNLFVSPETFTIDLSLILLAALMIGGVGSNVGALLGALFITLVPEFLQKYGDLELLFYGITIILVIIYFPKGIAGGLDYLSRIISSAYRSSNEKLARD
ncbi:branched-chain amino acid ABC transporter permease [Bacillaceae bacterium]